MIKKSFKLPLILGVASLSLASCNDYDAGITSDVFKQKEYADNFKQVFGETDPNQDWSMAATLTANISVGNNPSVMIYSGKPGYAGTKPLGLINGKSGIFNAVKGTEQVYAVVTENGQQIVAGFYDVVEGVVAVSNTPVAQRAAQTRAEGDPTRSADPIFTHQTYDVEATWDGKTYQVNPWNDSKGYAYVQVEIVDEENQYFMYWSATKTGTFRKLAHNVVYGSANTLFGYAYNGSIYYADGEQEEALTMDYLPNYIENKEGVFTFKGPQAVSKQRYDGKYYTISDTKTTDVEWKIGDCSSLFWDGDACFLESEDFRSARKQAVYAEHGATVADLQKAVEFTTIKDNQTINIPMMYGATVKTNIFGYYYYRKTASGTEGQENYKPAQDPRTVNRYVLYDDARPSTNIKVDGTAVGGMSLASRQSTWTDESVVTCTSRRLVYFGEKGENTEGTYNFPQGITIGFFMMKKPTEGDYVNLNGCSAFESWTYSSPSLNAQYFYDANGKNQTLTDFWSYTYGNDVVSHDYGTPGVDGKSKAISWTYGDMILCGFGDNSGDEDLNDFVFWYDSEVADTEKPKIKITTEETTTKNSWIFACEDLGGTYDYDFNDIVWEVSQEYVTTDTYEEGVKTGSTTTYGDIKINLLASGGTLPVEIVYDNVSLGETHQAFGQAEAETYSPVNVGASTTKSPVTLKTINTTTQVDINSMKNLFKVKVSGADGVKYYVTAPTISAQNAGSDATPQMILLPGEWRWPQEGIFINAAYPDFTQWANDATWTSWSANYVASKTTSR